MRERGRGGGKKGTQTDRQEYSQEYRKHIKCVEAVT